MINFILLSSLLQSFIVKAAPAPAFAFETVNAPPAFVTVYDDGASPDDAVYSTDFANAQSYTTTLWPASPTSEYHTVLPETSASPPPPPPAAAAATPPPTSQAPPPPPPPPPTSQAPPSPRTTSQAPPPPPVTSSYVPPPPPVPTTTAHNGPRVTSVPKYIVYSPYNNDQSCKNADSVKRDLQDLASKGVKRIRMYATDCNSLETVQPAAKELGIRIVQGLWIGTSGTQNALNQLGDLISAAKGDWSNYDSIIVGNEDVTNGYISADTLLSLTKQVRSELNKNGFNGDVIIAETTTAYINNPTQLCDSSLPFIGLNAHSYFAASFDAQRAGEFIGDQKQIVQGKCNRGDIWISETGYPHKGDDNGANVPNKQNQADAINAILAETNDDCVILAQFDDMWKQPGPHGIEQYFGMIDLLG